MVEANNDKKKGRIHSEAFSEGESCSGISTLKKTKLSDKTDAINFNIINDEINLPSTHNNNECKYNINFILNN